MITKATISHYKSINEAELIFRKINVIVGPNGSGKSNLLDAIYFLHDCAVDDIDTAVTKRHGIDSLRQWSRTRPYNINIALEFINEHGNGNYKVTISSNKGQYKIIEEIGAWTGPHPRFRVRPAPDNSPHFHTQFRRNEQGFVKVDTTLPDYNFDNIEEMQVEDLFLTTLGGRNFSFGFPHLSPIHDELASFSKYNIFPNTLRMPQIVSRETTLLEDGSNLSSVLKRINSVRRFSEIKEDIISSIKMMMPMVSDFQIKSAAGYFVPVLRVEEANGESHDFNLSQISDGTLRTLGLLAAFYQPAAPTKIGIEEPELMIHPGALPVLFEAMTSFIEKYSSRSRQVFITTHSPTFIDLFEPKDLIWCRLKSGSTECGHVKKRQLDIIKKQLFTAGELLLAEGFF